MKGELVSDGCSFNMDRVHSWVLPPVASSVELGGGSGGGRSLAGSMPAVAPSVTSTPDTPLEPTRSVGRVSCPSCFVSNGSVRAFRISAGDPCVLSVGLSAPPAYAYAKGVRHQTSLLLSTAVRRSL